MENSCTLCQKKTTAEPLKTLENKEENVRGDFISGTLKQNVKEPETPIIPIGRIYLITNLINNKKYVGITTQTLKQRFHQHVNRKSSIRSVLQNSIKKYGKENFKTELVEELHNTTEIELLAKETFYINKHNTFIDNGLGYNLIKENTQQLLYSRFTRKKMSKNRMGKKNQFYGKLHTDESKKLMSKSHVGIHHTIDTKKKLSLALKREKSYRFNRTMRKFRNIHTNEEFSGFQYDFRKKYNIDHASLSNLISGKRKSAKGWVFINDT